VPTVPTLTPQANLTPGGSQARFDSPTVDNFAGEQLQQLGQAAQSTGREIQNIQNDMQQQVNQVRVDDALNKARQKALDLTFNQQDGYKNLKGDQALTRPDGKPLQDEYGSKLDSSISDIAATLGNDRQRLEFTRQASNLSQQFRGGVQQHANDEYRSYSVSTQDGTIKIALDEAKLNWRDPDRIQSSVDSAQAAVVRMGTLQGWSGSDTTFRMKQTTSALHMGVIDSAMQDNNPEYALGYMNKFKDQMTADDLLKVRGVITKDVNARMAEGFADTAVQAARQKAAPGDLGRMAAITAQSESGNRERDAAGNLITSPKGAQGAMQVRNGTRLDPGYGVTPAKDDSDAERSRVGREYLSAMVKQYSGDPAKAWAAYNWGPGNLDKTIEKYGAAWGEHLPAETRAYVDKNLAALGSGGGAVKPTLQEVHDHVRENIAAKFGANPPAGMLKQALTSATQQFEDLAKATKADEEARTSNALQAIMQVRGRFSDLPFAVRSQIPPDKVDNVMEFGKKFAAGDDITNPAVFLKLSDPKTLTSMSDNAFFAMRTELSASDFKHFSEQRAAAQGKPANAMGTINMDAMNSALKDHMLSLGLDPTPKDGSPEAVQLGTVKMFVKDSIVAHQKATGKQMTDAETEKYISGLYAKSVSFRNSFLGVGTGRSTQTLLTMKAGDIPDETRFALMMDFRRNGIETPTDADYLGAYLKLKQIPPKQKMGMAPDGRSFRGTIKPPKG